MARRLRRVFALLPLALGAAAGCPVSAPAALVSGPHETVDTQLTTMRPNAPTGFHFTGRYHAAGDPEGDPPYMRKMISYAPPGMHYDTSVPELCTASDLELVAMGAAACPAGSRLGGGTTDGSFWGYRSTLDIDVFNNTDEQIMVIRSPEVATVARGTLHPDGSVEFASPTCYPALNPVGCPVDDALQIASDVTVPEFTRTIDGVTRSYLTTASSCPDSGFWEMPIRFWWADGSIDTVVTRQPCTAA